MALVLTEEQEMLRDSAREYLEKKANPQVFREVRDSGDPMGMRRETWSEMAELGWTGVAIPEARGGSEFGFVGAGLIMEEMGRHLTLSPFMETAVTGAATLLASGDSPRNQERLNALINGDLILALALDEGPRHDPSGLTASATIDGRTHTLNGTKTFIRNGMAANQLIVAARTSGKPGDREGITLYLVDSNRENLTLETTGKVDHHNTAGLVMNHVVVNDEAVLGEINQGMDLLDRVLDVSNICLAAELLGIAGEAFRITMSYMKERRQFGKAIGSFQALQHRAAHLHCELELARSVVLKALQAIDSNDSRLPALASLAKAKLCQVTQLATNEAIQMHGGIGMTDEYDIGFYLKRGRVVRALYGDYEYHADRYARLNGY